MTAVAGSGRASLGQGLRKAVATGSSLLERTILESPPAIGAGASDSYGWSRSSNRERAPVRSSWRLLDHESDSAGAIAGRGEPDHGLE